LLIGYQTQKNLSAPTAGLGQHEPPRLVLEVGDSNFLGGNARKAEVPPLETLKWGGDFSFSGSHAWSNPAVGVYKEASIS